MELTCVGAILSAILFGFLKGFHEKECAVNINRSKKPFWLETAVIYLMVVTFLSALSLSIADTLKALNYDLSIWSILLSLIMPPILITMFITIGYEITQCRRMFAKDYFRIGLGKTGSRIINLTLLGTWIGVTIILCYIGFGINSLSLVFCLLLSSVICAILGFIVCIFVVLRYFMYCLFKILAQFWQH